jgi:hypothetical protein
VCPFACTKEFVSEPEQFVVSRQTARLLRCRSSRNPTLQSRWSRLNRLSQRETRDGKSWNELKDEVSKLMLNRTNKDLDPVPRHARKWGVTSFISYWISDAFKYAIYPLNVYKNKSNNPSAPQHGNSPPASSPSVRPNVLTPDQKLTTSRPNMARVPRHSRPRLFHDILRHRLERRHRRNPPRALSRACSRILGFLGLLHRHHIARHPRHLLVRHPKHERRKRNARHDWCHLAVFPHLAQYCR